MPALILSPYELYVDRLKNHPITLSSDALTHYIENINDVVVRIVLARQTIEQSIQAQFLPDQALRTQQLVLDLNDEYEDLYTALLSLAYQCKFPETIGRKEKGNLQRMICALYETISKERCSFPDDYLTVGFSMERTIFLIENKLSGITDITDSGSSAPAAGQPLARALFGT